MIWLKLLAGILSINRADSLQPLNDLLTQWHHPHPCLHPQPPSQTLSSGHRYTTNHLSIWIDQCIKYGNSMATHCNVVSLLLSKTWQSIGQNPIKVESRIQWCNWFRGQIRSQRSKTEDQNLDGCEAETNCKDIMGRKEKHLCTIALVMEDGKPFILPHEKKNKSGRAEMPLWWLSHSP